MSTKLRGEPASAKTGARLALRAASSSKTSAKADHEGKDASCNKRLVKCVRAMVSNGDEWVWSDGSNKLLDDYLREHCAEHWKFKNQDTLDVAIDVQTPTTPFYELPAMNLSDAELLQLLLPMSPSFLNTIMEFYAIDYADHNGDVVTEALSISCIEQQIRVLKRESATLLGMSVAEYNQMVVTTTLGETAYEHNLNAQRLREKVQLHNLQPGDPTYPRAEDLHDKVDNGDVVHDLNEEAHLQLSLYVTRVLSHLRRDPVFMRNFDSRQGGYLLQSDLCRAVVAHSIQLGLSMTTFDVSSLVGKFSAYHTMLIYMEAFAIVMCTRPSALAGLTWKTLKLMITADGRCSIKPDYSCEVTKRATNAAKVQS